MNFEAIETAFELLLENVQTIENDLGTHAYDALIEQNSYYLGAEVANEVLALNSCLLTPLKTILLPFKSISLSLISKRLNPTLTGTTSTTWSSSKT